MFYIFFYFQFHSAFMFHTSYKPGGEVWHMGWERSLACCQPIVTEQHFNLDSKQFAELFTIDMK